MEFSKALRHRLREQARFRGLVAVKIIRQPICASTEVELPARPSISRTSTSHYEHHREEAPRLTSEHAGKIRLVDDCTTIIHLPFAGERQRPSSMSSTPARSAHPTVFVPPAEGPTMANDITTDVADACNDGYSGTLLCFNQQHPAA